VSDTLVDTTWLRRRSNESADELLLPEGHTLKTLLLARGLRKVGRVKIDQRYHYVWGKPGAFASDEEAIAIVRDWFASGSDLM